MNKKKMYLYLGIGVGSIALIVIIVIVVMMAFGSKSVSYSTIESRMVTAAKNYYKKNSSNLPTEEGGQITVDIATLTTSGDLKPVSEMTEEGVSCSGNVIVTKTNNGYQYSPYLDCGSEYKTSLFYEKLIQNNVISEFGEGLYPLNDGYVYKGDDPNNYLEFAGAIFRMVKINPDHSIVAIYSGSSNDYVEHVEWDDHYNAITDDYGINDYSQSSIRKVLSDLYVSDFFSEDDLNKMVPYRLCVAARSKSDTSKDGSVECQKVIERQYLGLLPFFDYMNASLDSNCNSFESGLSCANYNYLENFGRAWWSLTASSASSELVYQINSGPSERKARSNALPRFVITLGNYVVYDKGTGTQEDPYIIK